MRISKLGLVGAAIVLGTCVAAGAFAQDPAQPPAAGRRPGGGQGRGGFGQGRFGGGFGQLSILNVSPDLLASELKLTDDQKMKIGDAQKKYQTDLRASFQRPADGQQPDPQARRQKMQEITQTANKEIDAVLNTDQKTESTALLKNLQSLQALSIPYATYSDLKLTADQKTKLVALAADVVKARQAKQQELQPQIQAAAQAQDQAKMQELMAQLRGTGKPDEKALALLTDDQKGVVTKYIKDHPAQPGRFGPGARTGVGAAQ